MDLVEERSEDISVVVGHLALKDTGDTLEAHACIDVASGQRREASIQFTVELEMGEERERCTCMKTRFQISRTLGSSWLTRELASRPPILS